MSTLNEYLVQKKAAFVVREEKASSNPNQEAIKLSASVRAADRSGVREIRIRDFQIISDSAPDFAGYNLGPGSPELQLGVLGSCVTHITLIQAALLGLSLDSLGVEVTADFHPFAGTPGYEDVPVYPHNIHFKLNIASPESSETLAKLLDTVEKVCPILNLLANPQTIGSEVVHTLTAAKS